MTGPRLVRTGDGGLKLADLAPWFVSVILELPELLDPDQSDDVKSRLYPDPSDDPEQSGEWEKYVHPELFALLASAREIVTRDLASLMPSDEESPLGLWEVQIPGEHINAWISALNAARVTLGASHEIEEDDMNEDRLPDEDPWDDRRLAVAKIHLLGWLQQMIIEDRHPPPEGLTIPDSLPDDF